MADHPTKPDTPATPDKPSRPRGRPALPPGQHRESQFKLWLSPAEKAAIEAAAVAAGDRSTARWARESLLSAAADAIRLAELHADADADLNS